jgi:hypothetical protein
MHWWRALAVWLVIVAAESIRGILRRLLLAPAVGDFRARQISVFTGALIIIAIVTLFIRWLRLPTIRWMLAVGVAWVVLTMTFELVLGRLILGYSWDRVLSDYDLSRGGLLSFGLVVLALSPMIAAKLRGVQFESADKRASERTRDS